MVPLMSKNTSGHDMAEHLMWIIRDELSVTMVLIRS